MPTAINKPRIQSVDLLRGIIMVIMSLDHVRDFFHKDAFTGNPLDPATSYPLLYFTRWITHFCAPTFVFLSGLSSWLQSQRKSKAELRRFLITRGLWLVVFDLTIMTFCFTLDVRFDMFILETLWSIGMGLVVLGLLIGLPYRYILIIGLVILFGHNLLDIPEAAAKNGLPVWWKLLHQPGIVPLWGSHNLFVFYPFLSWAGLTLLGYCCGKLFMENKRLLVRIGFAAIVLFFIIRGINVYGDPVRWQPQKTTMATIFSFMNVQKYPPSLLYLLATMGPVLIALGLLKNSDSKLPKAITIFGRVPLFYFALHFLILHIATAITYLGRGHTLAEGMKGLPMMPFKFVMPGEGYSLAAVYGIWVLIVFVMYPISKWYDGYKSTHKDKWWLSYL
ncbi:MAG: DUF1624 domain-containing protein [Bacteroidetes bacterium]|nr:DUF1624 domain-containing protein [Bacteroidota bacterium]